MSKPHLYERIQPDILAFLNERNRYATTTDVHDIFEYGCWTRYRLLEPGEEPDEVFDEPFSDEEPCQVKAVRMETCVKGVGRCTVRRALNRMTMEGTLIQDAIGYSPHQIGPPNTSYLWASAEVVRRHEEEMRRKKEVEMTVLRERFAEYEQASRLAGKFSRYGLKAIRQEEVWRPDGVYVCIPAEAFDAFEYMIDAHGHKVPR